MSLVQFTICSVILMLSAGFQRPRLSVLREYEQIAEGYKARMAIIEEADESGSPMTLRRVSFITAVCITDETLGK